MKPDHINRRTTSEEFGFLFPLTALSLADAFHDSFQMFSRASYLGGEALVSRLRTAVLPLTRDSLDPPLDLKIGVKVRFKGLCKEKQQGCCSDPHPVLDTLIRSRHWAFDEEDVCADKSIH